MRQYQKLTVNSYQYKNYYELKNLYLIQIISQKNINIDHYQHKSYQMKSNERVVKKGNYYELQTMQDLMLQQRLPKKQDLQSQTIAASSANIPGANLANQNIITQLPSRADALNNYKVLCLGKFKTDDYGLQQYQNSLEGLLKISIRDEERLQIQKILKQITAIKSNQQLPLNKLPQTKQKANNPEAPKQINLISQFNTQELQKNVSQLQRIKYLELSRLEHIVQILLKNPNEDLQANQNQNQSQNQIDSKTKQQLQSLYNNLNQLKCINNLTGIVNKIASNESKYMEMNEWVNKTQQINQLNKQILDQFDHDELILNQLQESFKKNIEGVRSIIKKLSD